MFLGVIILHKKIDITQQSSYIYGDSHTFLTVKYREIFMLKQFITCFALLTALAACGSTPGTKSDAPPVKGYTELPIMELPGAKKGCATGGSKIRTSISNAQDFATTTARANLASQIKTRIQGMVKKYISEGENEGKMLAEELNTRVIRELTDMDLLGGVLVKSYVMGEEVQSVVCIEPDTFADAFANMKNMDNKMKQALRARAKAEFSDMDEQLKANRNR